VDVVLDAFALLLTEGYVAAAPALQRALELLSALDGRELREALANLGPADPRA
jgi:hypothetical protein